MKKGKRLIRLIRLILQNQKKDFFLILVTLFFLLLLGTFLLNIWMFFLDVFLHHLLTLTPLILFQSNQHFLHILFDKTSWETNHSCKCFCN